MSHGGLPPQASPVLVKQVSMTYSGQSTPTLREVDLRVDEAELVLVSGRTGSGKSTLLRLLNGLVPRFSGGHLSGRVEVAGIDVTKADPRSLAHVVGFVGQDPLATFVTDRVEDELAYGMEQLGLSGSTMRRRVEETLDLLGLVDLRERSLRSLSGGQQQRVALGAVLTMHPQVLVLDEPTSALDPTAAEEVLSTLARLVDDLGLSVLIAEHRMERVLPFADRLVVVEGGRVRDGLPAAVLVDSAVAPPIVELGRLLAWDPLPLSVRAAQRAARASGVALRAPEDGAASPPPPHGDGEALMLARKVSVRYAGATAVQAVDLDLQRGEVVALMGRNGSGKSSLLWALQGAGRLDGGAVSIGGASPRKVGTSQARRLMGLVPQTATDLLYLETVEAECRAADQQARADRRASDRSEPVEPAAALLERIAPGVDPKAHPRDLSEGQQLCVVLALVLTARPQVIALDEPTRGLDYPGKDALVKILHKLAAHGAGVLVATHDVEFVAKVASRVVVLAQGEVVSDGPTSEVLAQSPAFLPQVGKVFGPPWLTVDQVRLAKVQAQHDQT